MLHEIRLWFVGTTDNGNRSDKVYWLQIVKRPDGLFEVVAHWGRRLGKMQTQSKGMYGSHWAAVHAFNRLANEKREKGYELTGHKVGEFDSLGEAVAR